VNGGEHICIGRLSGIDGLWDCVPRVCGGGGGCTGGGVPLGAVSVLSWCGEVSFGGIQSSYYIYYIHVHLLVVESMEGGGHRRAGGRVS